MPDYDFRVDLGAMINAATNINDSLKALSDYDVEDFLPDGASLGSSELTSAVNEFAERWEEGTRNLVEDVTEMAGRLGKVASLYAEFDAGAKTTFDAATSSVASTQVRATP